MDRPRSIATLLAPSVGAECPFLCMTGAGTPGLPLRLVLLLRHTDMADETSMADAQRQTTEVAYTLDCALCQLTIEERPVAIELKDVFRTANAAATRTGTYYSAIIALLVGDQLLAAGIGRATLRVQCADQVDELIQPTTQSLTPERQQGGLLKAALGVGFSDSAIQTCDSSLKALDSALLMIEQMYTPKLPFRHPAWDPRSPGALLDQLCSHSFGGVSVAVVVGCPPEINGIASRDEARGSSVR
jgi:hypothetical protein